MTEPERDRPSWSRRLQNLGWTAVALGIGIMIGNELVGLESTAVGTLGALAIGGGFLTLTYGSIDTGISETNSNH